MQIHGPAESHLTESPTGLLRTIGRWSLVALIINTMIGASIFGLPALIAARLGRWSPLGFFAAFAGIAVLATCMAEVASQFREAGGPYLYARAAFGPFFAIQNGWLTWLSRIAAVTSLANLFIIYLGEFFPGVRAPLMRAAVLTLLIALLAVVNYQGVSEGNWISNCFTMTKVTLLAFFIVAGLPELLLHPAIRVMPPATPTTATDWFETLLLIIYSYGGFEAALIASDETRDARKDIPFALFTAIAATTILYIAVQYLVIHTIPDAGTSSAPWWIPRGGFCRHWAYRSWPQGLWYPPEDISARICCTPRESLLRWASTEISRRSLQRSLQDFALRMSRL